MRIVLLSVLTASLTIPAVAEANPVGKYLVYVGTYNQRGSRGIYAYGFDPVHGRLSPMGLKAEASEAAFLAVSSNQQYLYAVSEIANYQGRHSGGLLAYRTDAKTGQLSLLNDTASIGEGPCHLSIDKSGKFLLVANYDSGSLAVFPLLGDGKIGRVAALVQNLGASVNRERQAGPHAHFFETTPDNRFAIAADLGLDKLLIYKFDANNGSIPPATPPDVGVRAGAGPRHFVFHPSQPYLYLVTEMDSSVTVFDFDAQKGTLQQKQVISALPKDFKGASDAAEIQVDAKGKFLYVSNRGLDSITVFRINGDGTLTFVQNVPSGGKKPRFFAIDPTGKFLLAANQDSDNIVTFRISKTTGKLTKTKEVVSATAPVCFVFLETK